MDPQLQILATQLADTAVRNTAGSIADRVATMKAQKKDKETIAELEEIVNGLLSDKSELVRIAQAYEQELVAQRISETDIQYISNNFVPQLRRLAESAAANDGQDAAPAREMIDLIQPLLSVETVTVLQLIGFNFRKAIGEPLTQLVSQLISSKVQVNPALLELQRLSLLRETAYLDVAQDPEAHARLASMVGTQQ
jgi:hypothetical protein